MFDPSRQFQITLDTVGNMYCVPGYAIDLGAATTAYFACGITAREDSSEGDQILVASAGRRRFLGGSGKSMEFTGTLTGTLAPVGMFRQTSLYQWVSEYGHTVDFDDTADTADLIDIDGTTVIATYSTSTTIAPVGSFSSTTAGANTYNGGTSFTLTADYEGNAVFEDAEVTVSDGTAQAGTYSFSLDRWISDDDADFEIIDTTGDGGFKIYDGGDYIAERVPEAEALDPSGYYNATSYGEDTYNSGDPFSMEVALGFPKPATGYVYIELTLSSGRITAASGPIFGTSLPANSATKAVVPVAYSDGAGLVEQIHQGPILWK
jgi:hypothetical protein